MRENEQADLSGIMAVEEAVLDDNIGVVSFGRHFPKQSHSNRNSQIPLVLRTRQALPTT